MSKDNGKDEPSIIRQLKQIAPDGKIKAEVLFCNKCRKKLMKKPQGAIAVKADKTVLGCCLSCGKKLDKKDAKSKKDGKKDGKSKKKTKKKKEKK